MPSDLAACSEEIVALARESIRYGLRFQRPLAVDASRGAAVLAIPGACFVSLHLGEQLRGCVGQTGRSRPLAERIAENAFAAAFHDHRFDPLSPEELDALSIEVHVLGPLEPLPFTDLPDLYARLRIGTDGLQLERGALGALFLPIMWQQLPTPQQFVAHLLRKAGIADPHGLTASRFTAEVCR